MAETWPHLLLLLSLFNPLLSLNPTSQNEIGNSNWIQPNTTSPTALMEDRQDDTFPTVAAGTTDKLTEETEITATTEEHEDSSWSTGQDNTHVNENQQATSRLSTARLILTEAETTEVTTKADIIDKVTVQGFTISTAMANIRSITTDTSELPAENTITMETSTESIHPVVTTKTPETSATSTKHPGLSTSGSMNTTNVTMGAVAPEVNPGRRRPVTNRQPTTTTKPTTTRGAQVPAGKGGFPCSPPTSRRDGLVGQCLIAIAALAGVATIFIVSTIVLCTKLSSRKHRYRMNRCYSTEMICISSMLPDGNGTHGRPRIPKSNGALIPNQEDIEGDDLTLHSFLPETDRGS